MSSFANRVTANPVGNALFKSVLQPFVHFFRRLRLPSVPTDQTVSSVTYRDHHFKIRHRRHSTGRAGITQCFDQGQYDFPNGVHGQLTQRRYDEIVASGRQPLIVDCGANIGTSVVWFSIRYPQAHIVAIEPAPDNCEILAANTAGLSVDIRQAGVAPCDGQSHLDASHGTDMSYRTGENATGVSINMISIATILAEKDPSLYVPFLLKIDIEGAEKQLFAGDCSAIDRFPLIIMEPHDWLIPGQQSSKEFFRFHVASGRDFCMKDENVASIACDPSLLEATEGFSNGYC